MSIGFKASQVSNWALIYTSFAECFLIHDTISQNGVKFYRSCWCDVTASFVSDKMHPTLCIPVKNSYAGLATLYVVVASCAGF